VWELLLPELEGYSKIGDRQNPANAARIHRSWWCEVRVQFHRAGIPRWTMNDMDYAGADVP
jgi:hypothetical protein